MNGLSGGTAAEFTLAKKPAPHNGKCTLDELDRVLPNAIEDQREILCSSDLELAVLDGEGDRPVPFKPFRKSESSDPAVGGRQRRDVASGRC